MPKVSVFRFAHATAISNLFLLIFCNSHATEPDTHFLKSKKIISISPIKIICTMTIICLPGQPGDVLPPVPSLVRKGGAYEYI